MLNGCSIAQCIMHLASWTEDLLLLDGSGHIAARQASLDFSIIMVRASIVLDRTAETANKSYFLPTASRMDTMMLRLSLKVRSARMYSHSPTNDPGRKPDKHRLRRVFPFYCNRIWHDEVPTIRFRGVAAERYSAGPATH
jgi:hypothetical protein